MIEVVDGVAIFPPDITEITECAFYNDVLGGNWDVKYIDVPPTVKYIESVAFNECVNLERVSIPASVERIDGNPFYHCISLKSIKVDPANKVYDSREDCNAIIETKTNTLVTGCDNTKIPSSVEKIQEDAFSGCTALESIVIPASVETIEDDAFSGCCSMKKIEIDPANKVYYSNDEGTIVYERETGKVVVDLFQIKLNWERLFSDEK